LAALRKWGGHIGFQPVIFTTDHCSLRHWVTENVDTPSGPRGRRARWHETLSQFDLEIVYVPGPSNVAADAMSRFAYPASSAREDVSFHGSTETRLEVKKLMEQEMRDRALVGVVRLGGGGQRGPGVFAIGGPGQVARPFVGHVRVLTRSGRQFEPEGVPTQPAAGAVPPVSESAQPAASPVQPGALPSMPVSGPAQPMAGAAQPRTDPVEPVASPVSPVTGPLPAESVDGGGGDDEIVEIPMPGESAVRPRLFREGLREFESPDSQPVDADANSGELVQPGGAFSGGPVALDPVGGGDQPGQPEGEPAQPTPASPAGPPPPPWARWKKQFRFKQPPAPASESPSREQPRRAQPRVPVAVRPPRVLRGPSALGMDRPLNPEAPEWRPPVSPVVSAGGEDVAESSPPLPVQDSFPSESPADSPEPDHGPVFDADWGSAYAVSAAWGADWQLANSPGPDWPKGIKIFGTKMFLEERLCVPEQFVARVVREHHEAAMHVHGKRLVAELQRRYAFPTTADVQGRVAQVYQQCLVCQACEPPTWSTKEDIHMTPVPDRFMSNVCLDIFSMPPVTWLGQPYDCYLLCVDRLTGWMLARPTTKQGLTGERAAHLLMDSSWGEVGVPSVVTCDQGPQFTSQWFVTLCLRLGVRVAYSQAHRPQANGRAEVCGRILQLALRKMQCQDGINWVEALPRALRFLHDTVGDYGVSPYELVFGRERNLAVIPWQPVHECTESTDFVRRMEATDRKVAQALNEAHQRVQARVKQ